MYTALNSWEEEMKMDLTDQQSPTFLSLWTSSEFLTEGSGHNHKMAAGEVEQSQNGCRGGGTTTKWLLQEMEPYTQ